MTPDVGGGTVRLAWLDGLRGFATLAVVYYHLSRQEVGDPPIWVQQWVDLGKYGVAIFFILSGYVIPMSLERTGSLRRFWVGRVCRLYPAYLVAAAVMIFLLAFSARSVPDNLVDEPIVGTLAHATMLQGLLGVSNLVPIYWTLSYEMVFYLLVSALFTLGLLRFGAWIAAGLALTALVAGPLLPVALLTGSDIGRGLTVVLLVVILVVTVAGSLTGRRRVAIACALMGMSVILLSVLNGGAASARDSWQSMILLALMFAGNVVNRMERRLISPVAGGTALAIVLGSGLLGGWWYLPQAKANQWTVTLLLAVATFAVAFALRAARIPRFAIWLGQTSYSVYLLHLVLMYAVVDLIPDLNHRPLLVQAAVVASYLATLFAAAWWTHRFVEKPGQAYGRRLSDVIDHRLGPDRSARAPSRSASASSVS